MSEVRVKEINIAKQWSKSPTGRYRSDGKSNGTDFRDRFLVLDLKVYDLFRIDLDGTDGYGSSFLDEAFAGLVREKHISKADFKKRFHFKSDEDPSYIDEIFQYVDEVPDND
jgi:hypothetical protein